jgi:putative DNA primase/helicase
MRMIEIEFENAMRAAGIICKEPIIADGTGRRFANNGKGKKNAWYVLHQNGGAFKDWKLGIEGSWSPNKSGLSLYEREKIDRQAEQERKNYEEEKLKRHQDIAKKAANWWERLKTVGDSLYLQEKKIHPLGVRFGKEAFAVPLYDIDGTLWNLQMIYPNGTKRFMEGGRKKGCFYLLKSFSLTEKTDALYICEGFATGASIHEATGIPTAIAFDAGNLDPVIAAIRSKWPQKELIICADNDQWKERNIGKETAIAVAAKYNCKVAYPEFSDISKKEKPTDFNDLHCLEGLPKVKEQLSRSQLVIESDEEAISRLAKLSPLEFDRRKKEEAKKLGISLKTLSDEVTKKRITKNNNPLSEVSSIFNLPEPWPKPISGNELLEELTAVFKRFAVLPNHADTALALWIIFSWCIESVKVAPILAICSPEKQCGKTTVLSLVNHLALRSTPASNITPAALFRTIEQWKPTLIIDEADTFIRNSDELRGILNSGHTRNTAFVIRTIGEDFEPKQFSTWGAKAIALIGKLPDTLHDRSIVIELRRKLVTEKTEKIRHADDTVFSDLRSKLLRFSQDNATQLQLSRPLLPESISDRAADNWEPLMAIAELGGAEWVSLAHKAAIALSSREGDATTTGTDLLADIRDILTNKGYEKITTRELINELCKDEEKPWATFHFNKAITPYQLSKLLKPYGIRSKTIRTYNGTPKGFERNQFEHAWICYLTPSPILSATSQQDRV